MTIKENEMGDGCSTHVGDERDVQKIESKNLKGKMLLRRQA